LNVVIEIVVYVAIISIVQHRSVVIVVVVYISFILMAQRRHRNRRRFLNRRRRHCLRRRHIDGSTSFIDGCVLQEAEVFGENEKHSTN